MRRRDLKFWRFHFKIDFEGILIALRKSVSYGRINHIRRSSRNRVEFLVGIEIGHRRQQSPCIRVPRIVKNVIRSAVFDDFPRIHDGNFIRHVRHDAQIVRNENDGQFSLFLQFVNEFQNLRLNRNVERRRRLVADKDIGIGSQGDRDDDTLAHATRKLKGILVIADSRFGNSHLLHELDSLFARNAFSDAVDYLRRLFFEKIDEFDGERLIIRRRSGLYIRNVFLRQTVDDRKNICDLFIEIDDDFRHNLPIDLFSFGDQRIALFCLSVETRFLFL